MAFYALADPTRREIIQSLDKTDLNVTDIHKKICRVKLSVEDRDNFHVTPQLKMSLPALSKHLKVLENARLIKRTKEGREYRFCLTKYAQFWTKEMGEFEKFLDEVDKC